MESFPKLAVVTACTRVDNLPALRESLRGFPCLWVIVLDTDDPVWRIRDSLKDTDPLTDIHVIKYAGKSRNKVGGQCVKNFGIDYVFARETVPDFLYVLDDDNILHPNFSKRIVPMLSDPATSDVVIFNAVLDDNGWINKADLRVGKIDQAQYVVRLSAVGDIRIPETYAGDGQFAVALVTVGKSAQYVTEPLAYYNRLYVRI